MPSNRGVRRAALVAAALVAVVTIIALMPALRARALGLVATGGRRLAVDDRITEFAPTVEPKLRQACAAAGVAYPPGTLTLVGLKHECELRAYAPDGSGRMRLIKAWPILAASGGPGPKLRAGDRQVPEGVYRVESLNPNSRFHVALRVEYPSEEDIAQANQDGRAPSTLGGDIMIHGSDVSIGCLAMGDEAIEEIFTLAARTGVEHVQVLLCPGASPQQYSQSDAPPWVLSRYRLLNERLAAIDPRLARQ